MKEICKWGVREGTNNSFFAYTPCKPGFNYLSRYNNLEGIKKVYNNTICPICGKVVKLNTSLLEGMI